MGLGEATHGGKKLWGRCGRFLEMAGHHEWAAYLITESHNDTNYGVASQETQLGFSVKHRLIGA